MINSQLGEALMDLLPKSDAAGDCGVFDRTKAGDVFVPYLAIHPSCLDDAPSVTPMLLAVDIGLAKADKHA
jgi:hypothetical protein